MNFFIAFVWLYTIYSILCAVYYIYSTEFKYNE
jgi:hypothetical protein